MDGIPYYGNNVEIDATNNLFINTGEGLNVKLKLEAYYPSTTLCNFIKSAKIDVDLKVCGEEKI